MTPVDTLTALPASVTVNRSGTRSKRGALRRRTSLRIWLDWLPMVVLALAAGFTGVWRISEALNQSQPLSAPVVGQSQAAMTSVADAPVQRLATAPEGRSPERRIELMP